MTTFDDRDKAFENKFAHDEELSFKATSLANRMIALWAAQKLGKNDDQATAYAAGAVEASFENHTLEGKLLADLTAAGVTVTAKDIQKEMARLLPIARAQISGETK